MNFEYGDHYNFTEIEVSDVEWGFNHIFRNCEMNQGATPNRNFPSYRNKEAKEIQIWLATARGHLAGMLMNILSHSSA